MRDNSYNKGGVGEHVATKTQRNGIPSNRCVCMIEGCYTDIIQRRRQRRRKFEVGGTGISNIS